MEPQSSARQQRHGPQPRRDGLPHRLHTLPLAVALRPRQVTARARQLANTQLRATMARRTFARSHEEIRLIRISNSQRFFGSSYVPNSNYRRRKSVSYIPPVGDFEFRDSSFRI